MENLNVNSLPLPNPMNIAVESRLNFDDYPELKYCLSRDGFIIVIVGRKDFGKTDFSLLLDEFCYQEAYRKRITTNIWTNSYMIERRIDNQEDLDEWLKTSGRKLYNLDEGGKHVKARRAMSNPNLYWQDIADLIRHYDCGLTVSTPRAKTLDPAILDYDVCDLLIRKISRRTAHVWDFLSETEYNIDDIPKTHIKFNSKDIAPFTQKKKIVETSLPLCCKVAKLYSQNGSYEQVRTALQDDPMKDKIKDNKQIQRLIMEHCQHSV